MSTVVQPEVLIAGAGAAGLTLAIDLARRGVAVRLVDKASGPFVGSRGKGIQPRSQEVFEDLGVLDRMAALGGPYPPVRAYGSQGFVDAPMVESQPEGSGTPYRQPLMLAQNLTEGVLRARLAEFGVCPEFGCELTGFDQDRDGVTVRLAGPTGQETVRVGYLVGADGGGSFVRRALGIAFPGETLPGRGLVADLAIDGLSREVWHMWALGDGPERLALCPLAGTDLFQLQATLPPQGDVDLSDTALAGIVRRTGRTDLVVSAVHWRSVFGVNARLAERYRSGRVLLAGDAAHVHPPTGGQGLNTSIQDAYALGWRLAAVLAGAPDSLLDSYDTERRPVALDVLALSTGLLQATRENQGMRRGRESHELDLGYFDSPLVLDTRPQGGRLPAGARAPDAPCCGAGGQATRLFNLFRGPHATLLGYETAGASAPVDPRPGLSIHRIGAGGDICDAERAIAQNYDLRPGDWVLIRPDGYVGAIVPAGDEVSLASYWEEISSPVEAAVQAAEAD
jgi:2-polyprenyl-6-methoxyphenol hydroxylase-like FAD-dependent oxidoreductase